MNTAASRALRSVWQITRYALLTIAALLTSHAALGATIVDPSGDSTSHDILSISGYFDADELFLTATFATGTLDASNLGFVFGLDIDENPSTGLSCSGGVFFPCGAEWVVRLHTDEDATNARLGDLSTLTLHATLPVVFGVDTLSITVPLDPDPEVGLPDDGSVLFGLVVGVPAGSVFTPDDLALDSTTGSLGGPTTFIPEPGPGGLLALGLVVLGAIRQRRRRSRRGGSPPNTRLQLSSLRPLEIG